MCKSLKVVNLARRWKRCQVIEQDSEGRFLLQIHLKAVHLEYFLVFERTVRKHLFLLLDDSTKPNINSKA